MADNMFKTLGDYVTEVFDTNKDGVINFKDLLGLFPNNAVAIAFLVVDLLIVVAEYRVWDVGMQITGGDPYKALGFVLVSALPFYLAQVLWLYPRATKVQQAIAVLMGVAALYTSAQFGLADLSRSYDVTAIVNMVIYLTVGYILALLVYVVIDPGVKAHRMKVTARANADYQREINAITRSVLSDMRASLEEEQKMMRDFDPVAVRAQLDRLRGTKGKPNNSSNDAPRTPQNDTQRDSARVPDEIRPEGKRETNYTLDDYLKRASVTKEQAQRKWAGVRYGDFAADCNPRFDYISGKNMRDIYGELVPNPTPAEPSNHRR